MVLNFEAGLPVRLTSSGLVKAGPGKLLGIFVASGTPSLTIADDVGGAVALTINTGTNLLVQAKPVQTYQSITITGGTLTIVAPGEVDITGAAGSTAVDLFATVAATFYRIPMTFANGCYITMSAVGSITAFVQE